MSNLGVANKTSEFEFPLKASNASAILSATDLKKTYRLGRIEVPVLKGATLKIIEGEWIAVLGSSGSGKSTLLHLLGDLDSADTNGGKVSFNGKALAEMTRKQRDQYRNKSVGFVFQFYHLLPELSVVENVMLPSLVGLSRLAYYRQATTLRKRASEVLESCGLGHRLKHKPNEISGGERQRVAIARALMNKPKVLLADEPTGNLDEKTGAEILDLIAKQHRDGLTIVMVTHDPTIAERADRVIHLQDGLIAEK